VTAEPSRLLDVNVLVALTWPQHIHHRRAHAWLSSYDGQWATTPLTEAALIRLSMNPRVVGTAVTAAEALALLATLRRHPRHRFIEDGSSLAEPAIDLRRLAGHAQVTDLHLVNLCAERGILLATLDAALAEALQPDDRRHLELVP
jgi:uncharacterized protein